MNYPGEFAHIAAIDVDTWQVDKIAEVATPALFYVTSLAYDESSGTVFYTTDNSREWRDLNAVDLETGRSEVLLKDIRIGDLAFNRHDKSLWGVQHNNGYSNLVRIRPPYRDWEDASVVLALPFGKDLFDIDLSPDGRHLTGAIIEVSGRQRLVRMEVDKLLAGDSTYEVLYEFADNSPANFVHSPDGRYLYGTSYFTGVSNVFRYELASGEMKLVTNGLTGFFRPVPVSDETLIAFRYTAEGFIPGTLAAGTIADEAVTPIEFLGQAIVEKHPIVKDWNIGSPAEIDLEARTLEQGDYGAVSNLELTSGYPIVESYRGGTTVGMRFDFMEPVGLSALDVTASVSVDEDVPDDERFHLLASYRLYPWEITAALNRADFYDFFGPTKTSRKGYSLAATYGKALISDSPRHLDYKLRVAAYGGLDTLPDYQNVGTTIEDYQTLSARLAYHRRRKTIGALGYERGLEWDLNLQDNLVSSEHLPRAWGSLGLGIPLPWEHSSIWLRPSAGHSFRGDRANVFANFYFGGFGNNYVDHGSVSRFHELLQLSRSRAQRARGEELRQDAGRMEAAAEAVSQSRHDGRLRQLGAVDLLHVRHPDRLRQRGAAPDAAQRRHPAGLQDGPVHPPVGYPVAGLRQGLRRRAARPGRVHGLAEDPLSRRTAATSGTLHFKIGYVGEEVSAGHSDV